MESFPRSLKIGILSKPPFIYPCAISLGFIPNDIFQQAELAKKHNCSKPGVNIEFLQSISLILNVGFTLIQPIDGKYDGVLPNGSRMGLVGQIQKGEVDMSSRNLWHNPDRARIIDYGDPVHFNYVFLVRKGEPKAMSDFSLSTPFTSGAWLGIFGCFVLVLSVLAAMNSLSSIKMKELFLPGFMFDDRNQFQVAEVSLYLVLLIPYLVLINQYTSILLEMIIPKFGYRVPFTSAAEASKLVASGKFRVTDVSSQLGLDHANATLVNKLNLNFHPSRIYLSSDWMSMVKAIQKKGSNLLYWSDEFLVRLISSSFCDLAVVMDKTQKSWSSFGFRKNSTLREPFMELVRTKTDLWHEIYWHKYYKASSCIPDPPSVQAFALKNVFEAFVLIVSGLLSAILVFVLEIYRGSRRGAYLFFEQTETAL